MRGSESSVRWLALIIAFLLAVPVARGEMRQGTEEEGQRLLALVAGAGNFKLSDVARDGYALSLIDSSGHNAGSLYLKTGTDHETPRVRSQSFAMKIGIFATDPTIIDQLVHAAAIVAQADGGKWVDQEVDTGGPPLDELMKVTTLVLIIAIGLGLWRRRVIWDLRQPHVVQVIAQTTIFAYWMLYWPGVWHHLPTLGLHIVLGYAADAAFCFARFGSWRFGLSPVPVVLSINLFEWFDWKGAVIAILVSFGSKALVHRGGRHIFNPSVAGLSLVGVITILSPEFIHFGSAFHTLNIPPNMAEVVILVALFPQTRFRILPVSIGAMLALEATGNPALVRPAIILAFTLLASDPATTPRTDLGKLLFGAVVGFGLPLCSVGMRAIGQPDDFAKVIPVALANVLVPQLDSLARWAVLVAGHLRVAVGSLIAQRWALLEPSLSRLGSLVLKPVPNYALVGFWLVLCLVLLREEKPRDFEPAWHWNWGTPLVMRGADDVPRCANNPVFCEPFTFVREAGLWLDRVGTVKAADGP